MRRSASWIIRRCIRRNSAGRQPLAADGTEEQLAGEYSVDIISFVLLLVTGSLAGFIAASCRTGEGVILVPATLFYFHDTGVSSLVATHLAIGTSLLVMVVTSGVAAFQFEGDGHVIRKAALSLIPGGVLGAVAGCAIAAGLEGTTLQQVFALLTAVVAVRLFMEQRKPKGEQVARDVPPALFVNGLASGLITPLSGGGAGWLLYHILYSYQRFPLMKSLGTSAAVLIATAAVSAAGFAFAGFRNPLLPVHTIGYVDYLAFVPLALGAVPCSMAGRKFAGSSSARTLRIVVAVALLAVAVKILFF